MDSVNGVTLQITVQMGIVTIIHNNHPILIWLPAWNMAFIFHYIWDLTNKNGDIYIYIHMVGGSEHDFYDFPFSWECHHPN